MDDYISREAARMADLIFRGVKNPANCSECFFWPVCPCLADFDDYSAILDAVHDGNLVRHEKCPVSPLPAEHGRLIDADAPIRAACCDGTIHKTTASRLLCEHSLLDLPKTIVPAEGGADNG